MIDEDNMMIAGSMATGSKTGSIFCSGTEGTHYVQLSDRILGKYMVIMFPNGKISYIITEYFDGSLLQER